MLVSFAGNTRLFCDPNSFVRGGASKMLCPLVSGGDVETSPFGLAIGCGFIVADTNNHRIQIFDKEGRFKFQFGECGKRDGQLLYPNRVSVVKSSGDIIVTTPNSPNLQ
jgi:hypothetical protein